jgi:hypothetical protein
MKPRFLIRIGLIVSLVWINSGMAQQSEWRGKIEVAEGVSIVTNPKEPIHRETVFSLGNPLRIGETGGEDYLFEEIGAIAVDDADRIYVADWKASRIKIFDKNGLYLKTLGRKGQGPGEFDSINSLQIIDHNKLVVFDGHQRRLSFFNLDGVFERSLIIQQLSPLEIEIGPDGCSLIKAVQLDPVTAKAGGAIKLYDPEFHLIKVLATDKPQDVFTPFLPYSVSTFLAKNGILFGNNERYSFSLCDPQGNVIRTISRDYQPVPVSAEDREAQLRFLKQPPNKAVPGHYPAYQGITVDPNNRIIVQTWEQPEQGGGRYYDVFDIDGRFTARIVLKHPPRLWKKNWLFSVEEDEEGLPQVVRYTVVWKI